MENEVDSLVNNFQRAHKPIFQKQALNSRSLLHVTQNKNAQIPFTTPRPLSFPTCCMQRAMISFLHHWAVIVRLYAWFRRRRGCGRCRGLRSAPGAAVGAGGCGRCRGLRSVPGLPNTRRSTPEPQRPPGADLATTGLLSPPPPPRESPARDTIRDICTYLCSLPQRTKQGARTC